MHYQRQSFSLYLGMVPAQQLGQYRKLVLLGLLVQLVAAWFSVGYNHYDEHFQVLEFCNYKLGLSPSSALPWEFATQCRGALQPFMAWGISKLLMAAGLYNPFHVAFLLRLMMCMLTWLVTCRLVRLLLPAFTTQRGRYLFVGSAFLLWFVAYCGVRFSAENIAGVLFLLALSLMPGVLANGGGGKRSIQLAIAGLLLGFVFMLRLQMAFAYIGMGLWLLFYSKWKVQDWVILILGSVAAIGVGVLADHWFYGEWLFTPYNYFKVNILQHAAAKFGVYPFWYYITLFIQFAVPPLSVLLLPLFFVGAWKKPMHIFTWICITFIVGHSAIGHKEMRFLLPMTVPFIFLACYGLDWLMGRYPDKWFFRWPVKTLMVINCLILAVKIIIPSHESIPYYQFIYNYAGQQPTVLVSYEQSPYHLVDLNSNFYRPANLVEAVISKPEQIDSVLHNAQGRAVLFLNPQIDPIPVIAACEKEQLYCLLPGWVRLLNFNDWQSRSFIWTIYRLR